MCFFFSFFFFPQNVLANKYYIIFYTLYVEHDIDTVLNKYAIAFSVKWIIRCNNDYFTLAALFIMQMVLGRLLITILCLFLDSHKSIISAVIVYISFVYTLKIKWNDNQLGRLYSFALFVALHHQMSQIPILRSGSQGFFFQYETLQFAKSTQSKIVKFIFLKCM